MTSIVLVVAPMENLNSARGVSAPAARLISSTLAVLPARFRTSSPKAYRPSLTTAVAVAKLALNPVAPICYKFTADE